MNEVNERAWGDFWAQQQGHSDGGCLPDGYRAIETAQRQAWSHFAGTLERGSAVLDLATGDGRVMAWLLAAGDEFALTGVDLAPKLPPPPAGAAVRAGVAMEELPFENGQFDAVVSQFGFEYGDVSRVATEVARVLKHGGTLAILTHRIDGPILAHNAARRMQIGWIFDRKDLFRIAHEALEAGATTAPIAVLQAVQEGAQRFGSGSAAWEIAEAVRRTMEMRSQQPREQVAATLRMIAERAANEIARINSLEAACRTTADDQGFKAALDGAGFTTAEMKAVCEAEGASPFADFRVYRLAR
ncbi:class I SAM-dependent methyltransferase [Qipengyuania sp. CAU 1752]